MTVKLKKQVAQLTATLSRRDAEIKRLTLENKAFSRQNNQLANALTSDLKRQMRHNIQERMGIDSSELQHLTLEELKQKQDEAFTYPKPETQSKPHIQRSSNKLTVGSLFKEG